MLAASLLLAVAQPLTSGLFDDQGSFDVFFSLLIVAVLLLVFEEREHRRMAISLGLSRHFSALGRRCGGGSAGRLLLWERTCLRPVSLRSPCTGFSVPVANEASGDAIFGTVCGYLLLDHLRLVYSAVETASPGRFIVGVVESTNGVPGDSTEALSVTTASLPWPRWGMAT